MSIGTGEGEGKAKQALESALQHPLLDEICLKDAAGIIANFSGGDDLTFSEVTDTLTHLQNESGGQVEIIPGVINDPNLTNRAQVILIITGLGALPIDQVIPGAEKYLTEIALEPESISKANEGSRILYDEVTHEPLAAKSYAFSGTHSQVTSSNLDVPAFLRKRMKG